MRFSRSSCTSDAAALRPGGCVAERSGTVLPGGMCEASASRHHPRPPGGPSGGDVTSGACGNTNRPPGGNFIVCVKGAHCSAEEPYPWSRTSVGGPFPPDVIVVSRGARSQATALNSVAVMASVKRLLRVLPSTANGPHVVWWLRLFEGDRRIQAAGIAASRLPHGHPRVTRRVEAPWVSQHGGEQAPSGSDQTLQKGGRLGVFRHSLLSSRQRFMTLSGRRSTQRGSRQRIDRCRPRSSPSCKSRYASPSARAISWRRPSTSLPAAHW